MLLGEFWHATCATKSELARFRYADMATDIMDNVLKNTRNTRWTKAFEIETSEASQSNVIRASEIGS